MRTILFALLFAALPVFAATPTISSANLSGGTLTITGSNFGTKSTAAPFFFQQFTTQNNVTDADLLLGYADQRVYASGDGRLTVNTSGGPTTGRGAMTMTTSVGSASHFPHVAVDTSNTGRGTLASQNTDELYISFWMRFELVAGAEGSIDDVQIKSVRSGTANMGDDYYSAKPRYHTSFYPLEDLSGYNGTYIEPVIADGSTAAGPTGERYDSTHNSTWNNAGWNFVQLHQKYNAIGSSDGFIRYLINGVYINADIAPANFSAIEVRDATEGSKHFTFTMFPGIDSPDRATGTSYRLSIADHYIDTTPQRVMVGNASTYSAMTNAVMCPPATWSTGITCTVSNVPSGYNWVYVTNELGETNATGFAYSSGITDINGSGTGVETGSNTADGAGTLAITSSGTGVETGSSTASGVGVLAIAAAGTGLDSAAASASGSGYLNSPTETRIKNPPREIIKDRIKDRISKRKGKVIPLREVVSRQSMKKAA